jgi:hypothetical protein
MTMQDDLERRSKDDGGPARAADSPDPDVWARAAAQARKDAARDDARTVEREGGTSARPKTER